MNALDELQRYLGSLERRLRGLVFWRGAAVVAVASLSTTILLVIMTNRLAFSPASVTAARVLLGMAVALAVAFGLIVPVLTITRIHAARAAERRRPDIEQRLLTVAERSARDPGNPFLELLAADTVPRLEGTGAGKVVSGRRLVAYGALAAATAGVLVWLVAAGPGFWGHGAALLWAGPPPAGAQPYYEILVHPGNRTLRRGASQMITAQLRGFQVQQARLVAKYRSAAKWEAAAMQPEASGPGWQFLFAGLPETVDYFVEAGNLRSKTSTLEVVDLPGVKRIRVTYRYPRWTGLPDAVEDPGGDLRAVEGTEAEVAVETDKPLANGRLMLDDGAAVALQNGPGNWRTARVVIQKDGRYHIAALERDEAVRLSEDYFIEAEKDSPPAVRLARPGRDARVSPIEEVTVEAAADDDFGLQDLTLHYAVNGGPEKTVSLLTRKGAREGHGSTLLYLEDYNLVPGDIVSLYATARDARSSSSTDIFFLEAQPYEREYSQSQQMGGGEGAAGSQSQQQISQRQKEIIAATWNQMRNSDRSSAAENAKFLSEMQSKLRDQARSLATRMTRRELAGANQEFQSFSENMQKAADAMGPAAEKLKSMQWREALPPEQKALQHLLRAEALFRQIQIAFGNRQGGRGGGGGGMGRDLENLFDLELDTEKNQYETGQRAASGEQRAREIEEALQRLEQLARRQQELAQQARQNRQSFEQRWQQELLRREAEQLQQRMEQLTRGGSPQQAAERGAASSERLRSPQERLRAMSGGRQGMPDERLRQALERLEQATRDMRSAGRPQSSEAEARRAAERLQEARDLLRGLRSQQAAERIEDMSKRAEELARRQQDFAERLARAFPRVSPESRPPAPDWQQAEELSREKLAMLEELQRLEREMQEASRELAGSQRGASARLREALGEMQKGELSLRMRYAAEMLRRGMGRFLPPREAPVTAGLNQLRDQLREAQSALDRAPAGGRDLERALAGLERFRRQLQGGERGDPQYRGGGGPRRSDFSAMNRGDWQPPDTGGVIPRPGDPSTAYREGLRDLSQLRQALRDYPEVAADLQQLLREMEALDPRRFPGNPQLLEQMRAQLLPRLENLELQLRRKLEEGSGGNVRSGASEPVPAGYAEAVAEYFRRLSQGR